VEWRLRYERMGSNVKESGRESERISALAQAMRVPAGM
jgi:hypothetical protein